MTRPEGPNAREPTVLGLPDERGLRSQRAVRQRLAGAGLEPEVALRAREREDERNSAAGLVDRVGARQLERLVARDLRRIGRTGLDAHDRDRPLRELVEHRGLDRARAAVVALLHTVGVAAVGRLRRLV